MRGKPLYMYGIDWRFGKDNKMTYLYVAIVMAFPKKVRFLEGLSVKMMTLLGRISIY